MQQVRGTFSRLTGGRLKKKPRITWVISCLAASMLIVWWTMHSMLRKSAASTTVNSAESPPVDSKVSASSSLASSLRGADQSPQGQATRRTGEPSKVSRPDPPPYPPSLTASDTARLNAVLGAPLNFTRAHFITIPDWVTKPPSSPPPPCLWSPQKKTNVFLLEEGWADAGLHEAHGAAECPSPVGGQRPLAAGDAPEVSVVLSFRDLAKEAKRALLSVIHNARDVESIEVILLDIASRSTNHQNTRSCSNDDIYVDQYTHIYSLPTT